MKRKAISAFISVAALTAAGVAAAPVASAASPAAAPHAANGAYGCAGTAINGGAPWLVKNSAGVTISDVYVYWNASTQKNCAVNVRTAAGGSGSFAGYLGITIIDPGNTANVDSDYGDYASYAGPVSIVSPGCVSITAETQPPSGAAVIRNINNIACG
ncbi:hypothetical protein OG552_24760 [Streptomyces sp. NBC_01476]|uniref:hypothetical protein n=1 Tax=Streptomyces sp. NBC_01476 TaxID=2903881 RepID=UPI002E343ECC|nr:hypothetical protein [Streptomyces sp. NBC_01476]